MVDNIEEHEAAITQRVQWSLPGCASENITRPIVRRASRLLQSMTLTIDVAVAMSRKRLIWKVPSRKSANLCKSPRESDVCAIRSKSALARAPCLPHPSSRQCNDSIASQSLSLLSSPNLLIPPSLAHLPVLCPRTTAHRYPRCCAVLEVTSSSSSIIARAKTSS